MIARGCFIISILATLVLSWPVPQSRLENEDVMVMKCIVEALADVLSRPQNLPIRQECLNTLRRDERLVSILRHRNFLKELQDIALQGPKGHTQQQSDIIADHVTKTPQPTEDVADRSMLEALGGPGERSILEERRTTAGGGEKESSEKKESQEGNEIKRDGETSDANDKPDNRISDSMSEEENAAEGEPLEKKREDDDDEEEQEEDEEGLELKRRASEEDSDEHGSEGDDVKQDHKGTMSSEKQDAAEKKKKSETSLEEEEKRSGMFLGDSTESEKKGERAAKEEGELKGESAADSKHWSRKSEPAQTKKRPDEEEGQEARSLEVRDPQEVPHHSKEVVGEEGEEIKQRSPEVKELQLMARRIPMERGAEEEEGSAIRKTEDPEIASLAALESELENVAQKLHELRQG